MSGLFQRHVCTVTVLTVGLVVGACGDPVTPAPSVEDKPALGVITCRADVVAGAISCLSPNADPVPGLSLSIMLGGQGTFVQLASNNVSYDSTLEVFQAEITVQNLIAQALGTTDGTTLDPEGVRVFFHDGPTVSGGSGTVTVANATGVGTFTGSGQPYFQYDQILDTGEISSPATWEWGVPRSVLTFTFQVYVAAPVPYPDGWVEVSPAVAWVAPGGTLQLNAVTKDVVGRDVQTSVGWVSTNESVATVSVTGLVTGVDYGVVYVLAATGGLEAAGVAGVIVDAFSGSWSAVSAGGTHTCGLDSLGKAFCWGSGAYGQLGKFGPRNDYDEPVPVWPGLGIRRYESISAGGTHTCATEQPLWDWDGYCWGSNLHGELGTNDTNQDSLPAPVYGSLSFSLVTVGDEHTCALHLTGFAYCWGNNDNGQLGRGWFGGQDPAPYPVIGNLTFANISAGWRHTCAVTTVGELYCWGNNEETQLGIGSHSLWVGTPGKVITTAAFSSVSASNSYTCGVTTSNDAYCWGLNGPWIGHADPVIVPTWYEFPVIVQGGLAFASISASPGASGFGHTCGVTTSGEAYCWGYNHNGQLGDGTTSDRHAPTLVLGGLTFQSVSAGEEHTCGVTTGGQLYCWGLALDGRLGNGQSLPISYPSPQPVADPQLFFVPPATSVMADSLLLRQVRPVPE